MRPPVFQNVLAILRDAWAPFAVLLASFPIAATSYAESAYPVLHVLGGVALAYCFRRVVWRVHRGWPPGLSSLVAFALACTGALAWEIAEFAIDFIFRTTLQEGLLDTMTDLILAAAGAAAWLSLRRGVQNYAPWRAARETQATDHRGSRQSA